MRNITLLTNRPLEGEEITEIIVKNYPGKKMETKADQSQLVYGKYPRNIDLCFDNDSIDDPLQFVVKEFEKQIPFSPVFVNELVYHDPAIAKYVVEKISSVYSELFVYDDETGFVGKANDFIERLGK